MSEIISKAYDLAWSTWKRKFTTILAAATVAGGLSGAVVNVAKAWVIVEPKLPVSYGTFLAIMAERDKELRLLVAEHEKDDKAAEAKSDRRALDTQIDVAKGKHDTARAEEYRWQDKLDEATDPEKKTIYRGRVREFNDTKIELESQIKTLNKMRGQ